MRLINSRTEDATCSADERNATQQAMPLRLLPVTNNQITITTFIDNSIISIMKTATNISRIVLGLLYLIFGLDFFFHFIPYQPNHTGNTAAFKSGLMAAGYFYPMMKVLQVAGGLSLLMNRYAAFSAVVLFPVSVNVFLFHTILVPSGWYMGVILLVTNLFLGYAWRKYYKGMFVRKTEL